VRAVRTRVVCATIVSFSALARAFARFAMARRLHKRVLEE
jgi:hypothetical protein